MFKYSASMIVERAEQDLVPRLLVEAAMHIQRIQGQDPYDLRGILPLLKRTAAAHAKQLIWC